MRQKIEGSMNKIEFSIVPENLKLTLPQPVGLLVDHAVICKQDRKSLN